eukprot:TRINITY_DN2361_c0_g1_i1.p1 TRINITY_DN2361_c0_g1~~TRINITY_DN2361_c0_g1_i1.p1  ORF type:complete len:238 (-),score=63.06 TRINITY_DN2361_c0_g1_i1:29-742(-)
MPGKLTSWGLIERSNKFSKEYFEETKELYNKYYPIECNLQLPYEEKLKAMVEWWDSAHNALIKEKPTKANFSEIVKENKEKIAFRNGNDSFFQFCKEKNVPLLIFSAGLGDVIDAMLNEYNLESENVHVVSNFIQFDEKGAALKFQSDNIHIYNKKEANLKDTPFAKSLVERRNVILMGDSEGDIHMHEGIEHDLVFKVGFLNKSNITNLKIYSRIFDVVLVEDPSLDLVLDIFKQM